MKQIICVLVLVVSFIASSAYAQDLIGVWHAVEQWGARSGDPDHGFKDGDWWAKTDPTQLTLSIEEQSEDGRAFHGKWCSAKKCEDLVGVVKRSGEILMADEDGYFQATLRDDMMEVCYREATEEFRIAICRDMKRE